MLGSAEIFTILFITLGPLKMLGPFAQRTHDLDDAAVRRIAVWAFVLATVAAVAGGAIGRILAANWQVSTGSLAIPRASSSSWSRFVSSSKATSAHAPVALPPLPASPVAAAARLLFPIVLTPYGIAAVIVLLASNRETERIALIDGMLILVMVLNLLAMLYVRRLVTGYRTIVLQVVGAVLGVLQAGLAVEFIVYGLRELGILSG